MLSFPNPPPDGERSSPREKRGDPSNVSAPVQHAAEAFRAEHNAMSRLRAAGTDLSGQVAFVRHEPVFGAGSVRLIGVSNDDGPVRSAIVRECAGVLLHTESAGEHPLTTVEIARLGSKWSALITSWKHPESRSARTHEVENVGGFEAYVGEEGTDGSTSAIMTNDWPNLDGPVGFTVPDFEQFGSDRQDERDRMTEYAEIAQRALRAARIFKGVHYDDILTGDEAKLEVVGVSGEPEAIAIQTVLIRTLSHFSSFSRYARSNAPLPDRFEVVAYCPSLGFIEDNGLLVPKPIRLDLFARINRFDVSIPTEVAETSHGDKGLDLATLRRTLLVNGIVLPYCEFHQYKGALGDPMTIRFHDGQPMAHRAAVRSFNDVIAGIREAAFRFQSMGSSNVLQ